MTLRDWPGLRRVFRLPTNAARVRADVDAELEFHIQGRVDELMARGVSRADAEHEARRRFGDYGRIEAEVERVDRSRAQRRTLVERAQEIASDVRYAMRSLARQPMFAAVVVATLTIGIGATAAIFHAVDRVVLHPLPYPDADRIVFLSLARARGGGMGSLQAGRYQFWHDQSRIFDGMATSSSAEMALGEADRPTFVAGMRVTADYLRVIGTQPMLGRGFVADDFDADSARVAIVSYSLWKTRLGGDRTVLGRTLRLDDRLVTVIGVLPESFEIVASASTTQPHIILPLHFSLRALDDGGANFGVIARLRAGLTKAQIDDDLATTFARYRAAHPSRVDAEDRGVRLMTYQALFVPELVSELWILLGATVFVFLLACANVGNIVFARALSRQREFAVRTALGAGRGRIVRQVVLEMLTLGAVSAVLATGMSLLTVRGLVGLANGALLRSTQLHLDPRVVVYITLIASAASLLVGIIVALGATRVDVARGLAASARSSGLGTRGHRLRGALVTTETTLAVVLLSGAALLVSSFVRVMHVDGGFRREGVFTATIAHAPREYRKAEAVWRFDQQVLDILRHTPGVISAAATSSLPLVRGWNIPTTVDGRNEATDGATEWRSITPAYFKMMDIPLLVGRDFAESDNAAAPGVVVVSQSYAQTFFPGTSPIGQRILIGVYKGQGKQSDYADVPREIVGVVADLRDASLEESHLRHTVWVPQAQTTRALAGVPAFVVRSTDAAVATSALRRAITETDARVGDPDIAAMTDIVLRSLSWRRFSTVLMATFAAVALTLTCIGIYGVVSYSVSQRTQEIGVRMALGAEPRSVMGLVVRQGMRPAAVGLAIGIALALSMSRLLSHMLFGIGPHDPASLGIVAILLVIVALAASYFPARRAANVDPVTALRAD